MILMIADAGEFLVGGDIDDFKRLSVEGWISPEFKFAEITLFHLDEMFFVFGPQALENRRMNDDAELKVGLVARAFLEDFAEFTLNLNAHRQCALHFAAAFAVRAIVIDGCVHTFGMALTSHFHQAELRNGKNVCLGLVAPKSFFHFLIDGLPVPRVFHVDEIEDNEAAHVAKAQLAGNFLGGFHVDFKDGVFLIFAAFVAACVDVDRNESFRFIDDDVTATLEMDLTGEGVLQLARYTEAIEDRLRVSVKFDFIC